MIRKDSKGGKQAEICLENNVSLQRLNEVSLSDIPISSLMASF